MRNAFGIARWSTIVGELEERWRIDRHFAELVGSYLMDKVLLIGDRRKQMKITCGVSQSSILGPLLWNVFYDRVFDVEAPDGVTIIGYSDDRSPKRALYYKTRSTLRWWGVSEWLRSRNLEVAPEKTEVVLLSGRRKLKEITVQMCDRDITSQRYLKYLGVIIDKDIRMIEHVRDRKSVV